MRALVLLALLVTACGHSYAPIDRRTNGRYGYPRSDDWHVDRDAGPPEPETISHEHNDESLPQASPDETEAP